MTSTDNNERNGVINAVSAYLLWGLAPIYFKLISTISSDEIMVHRIIWSSLLLFLIVVTALTHSGWRCKEPFAILQG